MAAMVKWRDFVATENPASGLFRMHKRWFALLTHRQFKRKRLNCSGSETLDCREDFI